MKTERSRNFSSWPILTILIVASLPTLIMYAYLFIDTFTNTEPGSLVPNEITFEHWRFLWETDEGSTSIWVSTKKTH